MTPEHVYFIRKLTHDDISLHNLLVNECQNRLDVLWIKDFGYGVYRSSKDYYVADLDFFLSKDNYFIFRTDKSIEVINYNGAK